MTHVSPAPRRPIISDVDDTPLGRSFTIRFEPGDALPDHANPSRIVISVVRGGGTISLPGHPDRPLGAGDFVQLDAGEVHAVTGGDAGLELQVTLIEACCRSC